jgi:hypothetical protein
MAEFRRQVETGEIPKAQRQKLEDFAEEVRTLRLSLGENREEFAERTGVDPLDLFSVEHAAGSEEALQAVLEGIQRLKKSRLSTRLKTLVENPQELLPECT